MRVVVRMYRQGLGDCFLLTFEQEGRTFHLLIDCGALYSARYDESLIKQVVTHIVGVTGGELDAIALTHEHWDHVSGFLQAKEIFEDRARLRVKSVWTAWTEDPTRPEVAQLKSRFTKKKQALRAALTRMPDGARDARMGLHRESIADLLGFFGGASHASRDPTAEAWRTARALAPNRYLDPKKAPLQVPQMPDVRIYCLGPPEDPEAIKRRLSRKETYGVNAEGMTLSESFFAALHQSEYPKAAGLAQPFDHHYQLSRDKGLTDPWFKSHYAPDPTDDDYWRSIESDWLMAAAGLALHLDSYTNNTCLALAVELAPNGPVLLFPGDAQVGSWESWQHLSWELADPEKSSRTRRVTIDDLLARTVLYKVGHHGSHNGTMRAQGLEKMCSEQLVAMIPVHRDTAGDRKWEFPFRPLWEQLRQKARGRVLLADSMTLADIEGDLDALTEQERRGFREAVVHEALCVSYLVEI